MSSWRILVFLISTALLSIFFSLCTSWIKSLLHLVQLRPETMVKARRSEDYEVLPQVRYRHNKKNGPGGEQCFLGKAISVTYNVCVRSYVCVCVLVYGASLCLRACSLTHPAWNSHVPCYLRRPWHQNIFPHYVINGTIFGEKVTEYKMCFDFMYNFYLKSFSF
jgi:hypothetical protein